MKKFYKILTLTLAILITVTAFTVVALAQEEETLPAPKELTSSTGAFKEGTFSSQTPDTVFQNVIYNEKNKTGIWNIHGADNGNIYLESEYDVGGAGAHDNLDIYFTYNASNTLGNYPYLVFDLDVMTENGTYGEYASLGITLIVGSDAKTRLDMSSVYLYSLGLDTTPYKWQHLTYIVEHTGNGIFNHYYYINGEYSTSRTTDYSAKLDSVGGDFEKLGLYFYRMYPSIHNTASGNGKIGYDNFKFASFPKEYVATEDGKIDFSKMATYYYTESYELPFGRTEAKIGDTIYDNPNKAIVAAESGATVALTMNATETLVIDKNIFIDTNVYDDAGNTTGAFYTYDYKSSQGFVPTETESGSGIFSFTRSENAVDIIWDEKCTESCDCFSEYGGHTLTATTVTLLGDVPEYFGTIPTWEILNNGTQKSFAGWSYENDGTVDKLLPITEEDIAAGAIKLYPVYKIIQYNIEVTNALGVTEYFLESEFGDAVTSAPANSTVKLITDVYTECDRITITKNVTIDLNGHILNRCAVSGNVYEATKEGDAFVYGTETVASTLSTTATFFYPSGINFKLTITSSVDGGYLYNSSMTAESWTYEGEVIKRTSSSIKGATLLHAYWKNDTTNFNLIMNGGITVCSGSIWSSESASMQGYKIIMDDVCFNLMNGATYIFDIQTDRYFEITATNCIFQIAYNGGYLLRAGTSGTYDTVALITFKNCDLIKNGTGWQWSMYNKRPGKLSIVLDNSRWYDYHEYDCVTAINGTLGNYRTSSGETSWCPQAAEGWEQKTLTSMSITYTVPNLTFISSADTINVPMCDPTDTTTYSCLYNVVVTKPVDVNWIGADGNVVKTEKLTPAIDALLGPEAAVELKDDPYRNLKAIWVDAAESGKAIGEKLGWNSEGTRFTWQNSYTFYAVGELDGNKTYVGGLKDAKFNIAFLTTFKYNLYLPIDEKLSITSVEGFTEAGEVKIDGKSYKVYNCTVGTTAATDGLFATVAFTANEEAYTQTFKISAVIYADMILSDNAETVEMLAIGNMVRLVKEARNVAGLENAEKLDAIITAAGVADYKESYDGNGNIAPVTQYLYSASYVIYNGVVSYKFTLNSPEYADVVKFYHGDKEIGATVAGTDSYTVGTETVEKTYVLLDPMKVYDVIDEITIKVEGTELTGVYSILDFLEATPTSSLAKALYEFGVAAENYKAYLKTH